MKEKLVNSLGTFGIILYYGLTILISIFPFVMIDVPFLLDLLFLAIIMFIPSSSGIFWIWGLICAINGRQDGLAIAYYVLFVILFLPYFISAVLTLISSIFAALRK